MYCAETNVTGSQSSTVAVKDDVVNFTCQILFYGNTNPSIWLDTNPECGPKILPVRGREVARTTISTEEKNVRVKIPDGPATVFCTCRVGDSSNLYFWQSAVITVLCEYKTLPATQEYVSRPEVNRYDEIIITADETIALTITYSLFES